MVGATALCLLTACTSYEKGAAGDRCGSDMPCKKGLRCSLKKKKCYRPVNCRALAKRLNACTSDIVSIWQPAFAKLPSTKRVALIERVREHLKTEVVDHCRYDARVYRKKHGTTPPSKRSYGEDRDAAVIRGCLRKPTCAEFATCWLTHAKLIGDKAPGRGRMQVFPLALPRPRPMPAATTDGGVPPATDAKAPATDAKAPARIAPRPRKRETPRPKPR